MKLDNVDKLDDAGEVFFFVRLRCEVLDRDRDGRVRMLLRVDVSNSHFKSNLIMTTPTARLAMQSHVARILNIKVAYLLEQSHSGDLIAATSSTILCRDKLETSNRSPGQPERNHSSIKSVLIFDMSLRPAKGDGQTEMLVTT